eukprot:35252-Chlamydomonas_euryale.AAC.4
MGIKVRGWHVPHHMNSMFSNRDGLTEKETPSHYGQPTGLQGQQHSSRWCTRKSLGWLDSSCGSAYEHIHVHAGEWRASV